MRRVWKAVATLLAALCGCDRSGDTASNTVPVAVPTDVVEEISHPYWKRVLRIDGYEGWHCPINEKMSDGTPIQIRVEIDDPDDKIVQKNFSAIRERWGEIWSRIQRRTQETKTAYGYGEVPIRPNCDWFELRVPTKPIDANAEWSVMLQADEAGWLLDFAGWEDAGGQGVF